MFIYGTKIDIDNQMTVRDYNSEPIGAGRIAICTNNNTSTDLKTVLD